LHSHQPDATNWRRRWVAATYRPTSCVEPRRLMSFNIDVYCHARRAGCRMSLGGGAESRRLPGIPLPFCDLFL